MFLGILERANRLAHSSPLFKEYKISNIFQVYRKRFSFLAHKRRLDMYMPFLLRKMTDFEVSGRKLETRTNYSLIGLV